MVPGRERPLKVALVLSGAVALGSYEAGVACELLSAVAMGAPVTIDLVCGSSAGALIAAMVVKSLVAGQTPATLENWATFDLDLLTSRYESARQAAARGKPQDEGLLSSEVVRRLCAQYVRRTVRDPTFRPRHPAPAVALVVTMTNLDGLPGGTAPDDPGHFGEAVTFTLRPSDPAQPDRTDWDRAVWERISLVARASAAFPGAFDPECVPYAGRLSGSEVEEEWANAALLDRLEERRPGAQASMLYADGGIMDNRPLARAMAALSRLTPPAEKHRLMFHPDRCFLLVAPEPPLSGSARPAVARHLPAIVARSFELVESSLTMDIASHRTLAANDRLLTLLRFLAGLARRLDDGGPPPHAELLIAPTPPEYAAAVDTFYAWLAGDQFAADTAWLRHPDEDPFRTDRRPLLGALDHLRHAYEDLTADHQRTLREVHVALGSQLGLTQPWLLVANLVPDDPKVRLYGGEAAHFGAFLSRTFLAHDFDVGRYYARRWLAAAVPEWEGPVRPAPPPLQSGIDATLLFANHRPLGRMAGRALDALARAGYDLPAALRKALRFGAGLLFTAAAVNILLWAGIAWLALRQEPGTARVHALAVAAAASALPLVVGFCAGFLAPRRPLFALLFRPVRARGASRAKKPRP